MKKNYIVNIRYSNGYTCGCCGKTWDDIDVFDDIDEAIARIDEITAFGNIDESGSYEVIGFYEAKELAYKTPEKIVKKMQDEKILRDEAEKLTYEQDRQKELEKRERATLIQLKEKYEKDDKSK